MTQEAIVDITKNFKKSLNGIINTAKVDIFKELSVQSAILQSQVRQKIAKGSRSGKTYNRGSIQHQASAPFEPPKTDTGELVSSVFNQVSQQNLQFKVGSQKKYARHLEFGTTKMKPRPFLFSTFKEHEVSILKNIKQVIQKNIQKNIEKNKK